MGQVLSFRLVYDNDTGRPKGFGFAEFADTDAAASAVRNLDKYQIQGRELRVDYSHVGGKDDSANAGAGRDTAQVTQVQQPPANGLGPPPTSNIVGPLPSGVEPPPGMTCPDAISRTMSALPPAQLLDILSQMKGLATNEPARAAELLKQAPQLSYAIFQALLLMNLVDSSLIKSIVEQSAPVPGPINPTPAPPAMPPTAMPSRPLQAPPPQMTQFAGYGQPSVPTPPVQQQMYQAPPPAQTPAIPPGQEALIRQLLTMPQTDIDKLPPNERQQVMILRQQYGGMTGF